MASISTSQESSSASHRPHTHSYDVFLSFRGEDTRTNFTDHLYNALVAHGIHTFRDDRELHKGEDIKSGLSTAIEESKIFIIIFSKNYATSKWCLNELVKIMTMKEASAAAAAAIVIIPVFYHVNPRDVGHQSGDFEEAFINHEKDADDQEKMEMIKTWRTALQKAAKLSGYHLDHQHETLIIEEIRTDISTRLDYSPLHVGDNIVGMDDHLNSLKALIETELDDVRMVGIFGIGGIGKTTIAMAIYNDISSQFDGSCFLKGVSEESKGGLLELQKRLLNDLLKGPINPEFNNTNRGINVIKKRLCSKRVLIVLDDVDKLEQLENLAGKNDWFGAKSRIIITTKDTSLLDQHGVIKSYGVMKLKLEEATKLFKLWAFKLNIPDQIEEFESLSHHVVRYADGLPIALKVLGGFLCNKKIDEWKSALRKLEKIPHIDVQSILKVSYEKLEDVYKDIFLDIACFFNGKDKDFVARILGEYGTIGIKVLHERCLITIFENKLDMHDLIEQMGREVVRQECPKEPGERTRIWDSDDVDTMFKRNLATEAIEGLFFNIYSSDKLRFTTNAFQKMNKLRLLKVQYHEYRHIFRKAFLKKIMPFPMDFTFPLELRYLFFMGYPWESLPTDFHAKNLVELSLRMSKIRQLWKGNKIFDKLKVMDFCNSWNLTEIPDFSSTPNLEILNLDGCTTLESIPRDFHKLKYLQVLSCGGCSKLHSFPEMKGYMSKLRKIDFRETAMVEVPPSIQYLNGLEDLDLKICRHLVSLPENIGCLSSLQNLNLAYCAELKSLPSSIQNLKALQHLDLEGCTNLVKYSNMERVEVNLGGWKDICDLQFLVKGVIWSNQMEEEENPLYKYASCLICQSNIEEYCQRKLCLKGRAIDELPVIECSSELDGLCLRECKNLESLPSSICTEFKSLTTLSCNGCSKLKSFPEILRTQLENLRELNLGGTAITELPPSIQHLRGLQLLNLAFCDNLVSLPESLCNLSSLKVLILCFCSKFEKFPRNMTSLQLLESLVVSGLDLSMNELSCIHVLSNLRFLDLSHCQKLLQVPELPPSLRSLDVHACPSLETLSSPSSILGFSMFKCFKATIEEFECRSYWSKEVQLVIPGRNGIPEWINQRRKGSEITIQLPKDWWYQKNNDFLGFVLYSIYDPSDVESREDLFSFECKLSFHGHSIKSRYGFSSDVRSTGEILFSGNCWCGHDDAESRRVWVAYYPKVAINNIEYWSNKWRHLKASFYACLRGIGKPVIAEECGFHLIYDIPNISNTDSDDTRAQSSSGTSRWPRLSRQNSGLNGKRSRDDDPKQDFHRRRPRHL